MVGLRLACLPACLLAMLACQAPSTARPACMHAAFGRLLLLMLLLMDTLCACLAGRGECHDQFCHCKPPYFR